MSGLSLSDALSILADLPENPEYQGVSGLTKLLADTSAAVPGATSNSISLLYRVKGDRFVFRDAYHRK